jgi:hypothetical protein
MMVSMGLDRMTVAVLTVSISDLEKSHRTRFSRDSQRLDKFARARAIPCLESRFRRGVRGTTLMQKGMLWESTIVPQYQFDPFLFQTAVLPPLVGLGSTLRDPDSESKTRYTGDASRYSLSVFWDA